MSDAIELEVSEVLAAVPMRPGVESGLVVLTEVPLPHRSLSIYIGQHEARAVQAGQRPGVPDRPSTWDLYLVSLNALGAELVGATIDRVEESRHFFATLEITCEGRTHRLSCRPSDAVALVVRQLGAGLFALEEVLAEAGRYPAGYGYPGPE